MTNILVTGGAGQLGQAFASLASRLDAKQPYQLYVLERCRLDISSQKSIQSAFAQYQPNVVINAAAYTAVDQAELEMDKSFSINCDAAALLAGECAASGVDLIHLSTDYVFDGNKGQPYEVSDKPNPINVYGQSKLAGEKAVLVTNPMSVIVRTAWLYSEFGDNFQTRIVRAAKEKLAHDQVLRVVDDQWGSPTYTPTLVNFLLRLIHDMNFYRGQILHFSNERVMSRLELAEEILLDALKRGELEALPLIEAARTTEFKTPTTRPVNSALKSSVLASKN